MRTLDLGFKAHVESGATTLATCWKLTRRDALVLGFTDHDRTLRVDGVDYAPMRGLDGGEVPARLGAQVDTGEVVGILHSAAISEADIVAGLYDGAAVETWRVNWRDVTQRLLQRRATIGEIVREDGQYRAELRSGQQALNQVRGRIYSVYCDAVLGDARCTVAHGHPNFGLGCDRALATCRDRFGNVANFRGFPHIPGNDFVLRYPQAGSALNGAPLLP
ncbi:MAG: hypothetical protein BGO82_04060 [Devosia sp. 67-54]|uniref:DUF2163 domain-containing protein n=1 Tax=unclassified Devosia TaxID=196773 RepID=UPI00095EC23B|nr:MULTISPECIES: DUF2163 domain-containing protein [unclassified Devosia]MBN9305652.1 DUF2163 domain-containing protein [Devosia sp.]OJX19217.1 MAG: hypothetical protein BGO82_04060 [Devosia sp. 67-54]